MNNDQGKGEAVDTTMWQGFLHSGNRGALTCHPKVPPSQEALKAANADVAFLGFPWDAMCISRTGTNLGPKGMRDASDQFLLYNATTDIDLEQEFTMVDCGDVPVSPGSAATTMDRAQHCMAEILSAGAIPVLMGGDHSITIAGARAFAKAFNKVGMIHFDMHLDTALEVGGEELSHCCPIPRAVEAGFDPTKIVTIGPSGWMNPKSEMQYVKDQGINLFSLEDVWELGIEQVAARAVELASDGVDAVYLTVDIDSIDAAHAPGTGVPSPLGLTAREILGLISRFDAAPIRAFDIAEVSPPCDINNVTSNLGVRIILDTLATIARGRRARK